MVIPETFKVSLNTNGPVNAIFLVINSPPTLNDEAIIVAAETSKVELNVTGCSTFNKFFTTILFSTVKLLFIKTFPLTPKVLFKLTESDTSKVFPKITEFPTLKLPFNVVESSTLNLFSNLVSSRTFNLFLTETIPVTVVFPMTLKVEFNNTAFPTLNRPFTLILLLTQELDLKTVSPSTNNIPAKLVEPPTLKVVESLIIRSSLR